MDYLRRWHPAESGSTGPADYDHCGDLPEEDIYRGGGFRGARRTWGRLAAPSGNGPVLGRMAPLNWQGRKDSPGG